MKLKNILQYENIPRLFLIIFLGWVTFYYLQFYKEGFVFLNSSWQFGWIHNINLIFHEAGHVIFSFFPEQIMVFMGTGMQSLVPFLIVGVFLWEKNWFASSVIFWWLAQTIFDSSYYIADALERNMPLITNDIDSHDWWYLMTEWGLLEKSASIGNIVMWLGLVGMILGLVLMFGSLFMTNKVIGDS